MFIELRELLCSGAIRRHQLGAKYLLTPTSFYKRSNSLEDNNCLWNCCSSLLFKTKFFYIHQFSTASGKLKVNAVSALHAPL